MIIEVERSAKKRLLPRISYDDRLTTAFRKPINYSFCEV